MPGAGEQDTLVAVLRAAGVVFAEEEAALLADAATDPADLRMRVARRCAGEPLELVVGWAAFDGHRVPVVPGVFVPRRRSEALVATADRLLAARPPTAGRGGPGQPVVVLDLCCGTGALGVSLTARLRARDVVTDLVLTDHDPVATRAARATLRALGAVGRVVTGDLVDAVPDDLRGRVDVLLANVPYVPSAAVDLLPREARDHEPRSSLDGGPDGLDVLRRVAASAAGWLAPGGHLLTEATAAQAPVAAAVLEGAGSEVTVHHDDEHDVSVVVAAPCDT
jgi:release factor glutamine methyltransferase